MGDASEFFQVYMEETVRRVTLHSVLRQQAVFEGGGRLKFFQVPGNSYREQARNFSKSHNLEGKDIFEPRAYMGASSEFF